LNWQNKLPQQKSYTSTTQKEIPFLAKQTPLSIPHISITFSTDAII